MVVEQTQPNVCHVNQIIKAYPCGITVPLLCLLSDGHFAVVKYPYNQVGNKVLVNEWVCNKIAEAIDVPVPKTGCCYIDDESVEGAEFISQCEMGEVSFDSDNYGLSFYSVLIDKAVPLSSFYLSRLQNIRQFWNMLLFDQIVWNVDRHKGNLLVSLEEMGFYAIDCSNVFKSQRGWTEQTLKNGMIASDYKDLQLLSPNENGEVYDYFWQYVPLNFEELLDISDSIQKKLTPEKICSIIKSIPTEWDEYVNCSERRILQEYINYRVSHIKDICELIAKERGII